MALESIVTTDVTAIFGNLGVILALSACVAGIGYRSWAKYHDKIMSGEVEAFDRKFFYQAMVAFGGSVVVALPLVTAATEMINQWAGSVGLVIAWLFTAGWAYAVNDGTNGIIKLVENRAVVRAVSSGKLDKAIAIRMEELKRQEQEKPQPVDSPTPTPESDPPASQPPVA